MNESSSSLSQCPCGSGLEYDACCGPIIRAEKTAESAEALMRSRYTAYAKGEIDHLTETLHPSSRHDHDAAAAGRWAAESQWLGLEVRKVIEGGAGDAAGEVEFVAHYREKGGLRKHHEVGLFTQEEGRWYYMSGKQVKPETVQREAPKVGRNDPCPCGSGKKFKKCCGSGRP